MADYPKFCTSCGSSLEPGQKFCTACGAPVSDESALAQGDRSAGSSVGEVPSPLNRPGNTAPMPVVPSAASAGDDTQVLPNYDARNRRYRQDPSGHLLSESSSASSNKKILIGVIAVLAVLVCILVGVLFGVVSGNRQDAVSSDRSSDQPAATDGPVANSSTSSSDSKQKASSTDAELYETLSGFYNRLATYDNQIASEAKDFNANFLSKSLSTRTSSSNSASKLRKDIEDDYLDLQSLTVPSDSSYASCYSSLMTCYYDCLQRISVITEAWEISLSYSDPTGHEDEICEPLSRDKVGDSNKYYTEFKQTYPSAKPVSPGK